MIKPKNYTFNLNYWLESFLREHTLFVLIAVLLRALHNRDLRECMVIFQHRYQYL